jgi:hypothetical protein
MRTYWLKITYYVSLKSKSLYSLFINLYDPVHKGVQRYPIGNEKKNYIQFFSDESQINFANDFIHSMHAILFIIVEIFIIIHHENIL